MTGTTTGTTTTGTTTTGTTTTGTGKAPLAFIGLGAMGGGMAARLLEAGHPVTVWNRTAAKTAPLAAAGAVAADDPAGAAAGAEIILLSLATEDAVEDILFTRLAPALTPGQVIADTSTVSPAYSRQASARLAAAGLRRIETCVIGNPLQARNGELRVLAAGPQADIDAARPALDAIGNVICLGPVGLASTMKLVFNQLLGAQLASLAEAVALGVAAGLDRDLLLAAIENSGFSSRVMAYRAAIARQRAYTPASFKTALMAKDLALALATADATGTPMPVTAASHDLFTAAITNGAGDLDAAAVVDTHP